MNESSKSHNVWGPYPNYDDIARFEYGQRLWRDMASRLRFLTHWLDSRHPYKDRFQENRELVEHILSSAKSPQELDEELRQRNTSLRCVVREIPPVFGSFWAESKVLGA